MGSFSYSFVSTPCYYSALSADTIQWNGAVPGAMRSLAYGSNKNKWIHIKYTKLVEKGAKNKQMKKNKRAYGRI